MSGRATSGILAVALAGALLGGCKSELGAYYNANDDIVYRKLFHNSGRQVVVDSDGPLSRPAAVRFDKGTWVAWRHDFLPPSGELRRGIGVAEIPCTFEEAVIFDEAHAEMFSTPGLAVHAGRLVLAWASDDVLRMTTSTDGRRWTAPADLTVGRVGHVALAAHQGRLYAAAAITAETGGTITLLRINDDFTWGGRFDVLTDPALVSEKGVSLTSDGTLIYVAYAPNGTEATLAHSPTGEGDWTYDGTVIGEPPAPAASLLVPSIAYDPPVGGLRAAYTDGSRLWTTTRREPPEWGPYVEADVFTPSLSNPAGAALLIR